MLDSLGSTLSHDTINSFWTRFNKRPQEESLTADEAIRCLETELCRPASEKKRVDLDDSNLDTSTPVTPAFLGGMEQQQKGALNLDTLDFSGVSAGQALHPDDAARMPPPAHQPGAPPAYLTESNQIPLHEAAAGGGGSPTQATMRTPFKRDQSISSSDAEDSSGSAASSPGESGQGTLERVINVKNCPLCHRPRLSAKGDVDIVTHLAVCASQDWARVDKIVVGNYVTASQAQRKWYTKVISKVSSGSYKLGAVGIPLSVSSSFSSWSLCIEFGQRYRAEPS